jgi:hypothetical protein
VSAVKNFEEFIKNRVIKKQSPDKSRAEFLIKESGQNYRLLMEMLDKLKISDNNANMFIKSCYDILMELIRAKMLLEGCNASGFGAHEAEVSYLRVLEFSENDVQFADQMRFFRNGMLYYGTILDKEYAEKVLEFTGKTYHKIKELLKKHPK